MHRFAWRVSVCPSDPGKVPQITGEAVGMEVKGVGWLGTRTAKFEEMVKFAREVLGLTPFRLKPNFAEFELPDGDLFEIFSASDAGHKFMTCPMGAFIVGNVEEARGEMERKGIEFIGPIHRAPDGNSWSHFTAPDGQVYGITSGRPTYSAHESSKKR